MFNQFFRLSIHILVAKT